MTDTAESHSTAVVDNEPTAKATVCHRVGIDFGMTICDMQHVDREPFEHAFSTVKAITCRFGKENVFIVSKAKSETSSKISLWLRDHCFFEATGMLPSNVYFVREVADKRIVVEKLRLTMFIDDYFKVVKCLAVAPTLQTIVWFRGRKELLGQIEKPFRTKIVIAHRWGNVYKVFAK